MTTRDVLLALVALHSGVSGYELRGIIRRVTGFLFQVSLSQIYPTLQRLARDGLVTYDVVELVGRQDRKVYRTTPDGEAYLRERLREPVEADYSFAAFGDVLLRLSFMGELDDGEIRHYLDQVLVNLRGDRDRIARAIEHMPEDRLRLTGPARHRYLALSGHETRYLLADFDTKIAWVEDLAEHLDEVLDGGARPG